VNIIVVLGFNGELHLDDVEIAQTLCGIDLSVPPMDMVAYEGEVDDWDEASLRERCPLCSEVWAKRN
jgi:hypothetical protein